MPPKTAYFPDPADGTRFMDPAKATLSWVAGFDAILHKSISAMILTQSVALLVVYHKPL